MSKSIYSLLLSDNIVGEADMMASRGGQSRSAVINNILAEYFGIDTPEMRARDLLQAMEELLSAKMPVYMQPGSAENKITAKSAIQYKYNPTVKYSFRALPGAHPVIGVLRATVRTANPELMALLTEFFEYFIWVEGRHNAPEAAAQINGRGFTRELSARGGRLSTAESVVAYINILDASLKLYCREGAQSRKKIYELYSGYIAKIQK